jgi:hypothetical protein
MTQEQQILKKLDKIEKELVDIREHMVDVDSILTSEERDILDASIKNEKEGKLISLEDVENARSQA